MSGNTKFFLGVVIAAILVIAGIVVFSRSGGSSAPVTLDLTRGQKLGSDSAPVKIVEFGDFQCPSCAAAAEPLKQAYEQNNDAVQLLYVHFPLPMHSNAVSAALAAEAAGVQNKFWEMTSLLFSRQKDWESNSNPKIVFENYAKDLGLDAAKFSGDFERKDLKDKVETDRQYGTNLKVDQTPTFFVNGTKYVGTRSVEEWQKLIDEAKNS